MNARILAAQASRRRALRPLAIAELVVKGTLTLVLAAGVVFVWFGFQSLAGSWLPSAHLHLLRPIFSSAAAMAVCLITLILTGLFQPILDED
jgi:predicted metal-binding membrane protein